MKIRAKSGGRAAVAAVAVAAAAAVALPGAATAKDTIKLGVVSFLTGAAAGPFGVPAKNGAEMVIEAINNGSIPAPYNTKGMAGASVEAEYVDEVGGNTKQVTEYRNLVEKRDVDAVVGYISSGSCQALAPVVEELKRLTVFAICGTTRVFEDEAKDPKYLFRTMSHATSDNVAAVLYLKKRMPDVKQVAAINQNYAWGQDAWRDFSLAMKAVMPNVKLDESQWPKLFAGQYGSEISALMLSDADLVYSSFWDGDLESFMFQAAPRGFFDKKKSIWTVAETAMYRLGQKLPEGLMIGARGPYGIFAQDTALARWFDETYRKKYDTPPTGPAHQYAQAILALKIAYDKAAEKKGGFPSQDEVIAALEGLEFESFSTQVKMALANGHQAITENVYGITKWDAGKGEPVVVDVERFPAECVNPPEGKTAAEWLEAGMPGAKC